MADQDGSMSFAKFRNKEGCEAFLTDKSIDPMDKLEFINKEFGDEAFPRRVIENIKKNIKGKSKNEIDIIISKRKPGCLRDIVNQKSISDEERKDIRRARSLAPGTNEKNFLNAYCYVVPYKNSDTGEIRVHFTKNKPIKFLKNLLNKR